MNTEYISEPRELSELRELSGRLGSNPLLVQASTGNTSLKLDEVLWIKASGKWFVQAQMSDFLIPVQLGTARRCTDQGEAIPETRPSQFGTAGASIETAMHAALPHNVVVHVHSVNALAWALRSDAPEQLAKRLSGFHWQWIPYIRSGSHLAIRIKDALAHFPETNVWLLGNHGLVVCGESCESAERLLHAVEKCLALEPRATPEPNYAVLRQLAAGSASTLPACPAVHSLAIDRVSQRILSGGVLYPCQIIFLPSTVRVAESSSLRPLAGSRQPGTLLFIPDYGLLCSKDMTYAEQEMLVGLTNVVQRIDPFAPLRYLTPYEVADVSGGGSENYRRAANTNCMLKASALGV